jgi:hypothetical protein
MGRNVDPELLKLLSGRHSCAQTHPEATRNSHSEAVTRAHACGGRGFPDYPLPVGSDISPPGDYRRMSPPGRWLSQ